MKLKYGFELTGKGNKGIHVFRPKSGKQGEFEQLKEVRD